MGIYIKGMEMPKDGYRQVFIDSNGTVTWFNNGADGPNTMYKAKAIPVPPHGALMDRDAYRDEFMSGVYDLCDDDPDNCRANAIIDLFDSAPTVILADPPKEEAK